MSAPDGAASDASDDTSTAGTEGLPPLTSESFGALANKLGVNPAVRARMLSNAALPPAAPAVEDEGAAGAEDESDETVTGEVATEEAETETEGVEGETEGVEAETETEGEKEGEEDEAATVDVAKLQGKAYKQRKRAQRAEAALATETARANDLAAQLEKASPIVVTPSVQDPLAGVTDLESLERQKVEFRIVRDKARANPKGWVENQGKDTEKIVSPEEAAWWLGYTEDVLADHFPRKEKEIREIRPAAANEARRIMPTLFKKGTEDHQAAQVVLRSYPWLAAAPDRDYLLSIFLLGWKTDLANQTAANGKGKAPAALLKAHNDKNKVPLQKHAPPGLRTQAPDPKGAGMENVMKNHIKAGGSRESLVESLKALRGVSGPQPRSAAQV